MPVPMVGRAPDYVSGADLLDGLAFALRPSTSTDDDERLPERMCVPRRARARLERDTGACNARRRRRREQGIETNIARKQIGRTFDGRLRATAFQFHGCLSMPAG